MLEQFGDEIWTVNGPTVLVAGFRYPTRMVIIRLSGGALFAWSPIALSKELRAAVDLLGPVRHVVAPNTLHHRFIGDWRSAYPAAKFHAPAELRARLGDIVLDDDLDADPAPEWSRDIDQVVVRGNRITTEVVFFHRRSRTAIFTDLIQNFDHGWFKGWRALVARLDLLTAPEPTVPRKFRIAFSDRGAAREALQRISAWPTENVLMAHAAPIRGNGRAMIARAFQWLLR